MTKTMHGRFWQKIAVKGDDDCWEWGAAKNRAGYGWFNVDGKSTTAHRVSAWLGGLIPSLSSELHVLHKCDNPSCCNPKHFFTGTNSDNVADRVSKGRSGFKRFHGQSNGASKLMDNQVKEIRGLYFSAQFSQSQLAKKYGVHQPHISRIVNAKRCGGVL